MANNAPPVEDLQLRRIRRQTRWFAALLEGAGAALFIGILFRDGLSWPVETPYAAAVGFAFGAVALLAFLLWPMTIKDREFSPGRISAFGVLVVLLGSYLWLLIMGLVTTRPPMPGGSYLSTLLYQFTDPWRVLIWLGRTLEGVAAGAFFFGIFTFPIGIGIAWGVAIWGNKRL